MEDIAFNNVNELIAALPNNAKLIGVDGCRTAGKSTLAREIAKSISGYHIELDEFNEVKVPYASTRNATMVRKRIEDAKCTVVIDGICLLDAAFYCGIYFDILIYVKRMSENMATIWADQYWLEAEQAETHGLDGEVYRYHVARRPHEHADIIFMRQP